MKKVTVGFFLFLFTIACPLSTVSAHLAGQPPFFIINNFYSNLYTVPLTSLNNFPLPQDQAPNSYLVGQTLNMKLDEKVLPAPPEVIEKTKFTWDFGDKTPKGSGLSNTHVYSKMGSYILTIYADDGSVPTPQLLESALINIIPEKNYKLPQAVIKVEGQSSKDPLTDVLHFPLDQNLHFDATSSTDPEGKIVSYFWDFGDQQSGTTATAQHSYPKDQTQIFVVLRVTDSKGFISDNFVELENGKFVAGENSQNSPAPTAKTASGVNKLPLIALAACLLLGVTFFMVRRSAQVRGRGRRL
jgi:hypothetical protein